MQATRKELCRSINTRGKKHYDALDEVEVDIKLVITLVYRTHTSLDNARWLQRMIVGELGRVSGWEFAWEEPQLYTLRLEISRNLNPRGTYRYRRPCVHPVYMHNACGFI